jgi:hypothetical protein
MALACAGPLTAAPAPLPRAAKEGGRLHRTSYAGTWTLYWHGARGTVTLTDDGGYRCLWCGMEFVGRWRSSDGGITITESYRPSDSGSWHTFTIQLRPHPTADQPAAVRLERAR